MLGRRNLALGAGVALLGCRRKSPAPPSTGVVLHGPPEPIWGVQSGDVTESSAVVWSRSDRPSRMIVEWARTPSFADARRIDGPIATTDSDLTAKIALEGLPSGALIHYRVRFEGEGSSPWDAGSFGTAPMAEGDAGSAAPRDVVLAWSGDTNGQGFGIDESRGGMRAYSAVLARSPDLFVHCGDAIYADDPIRPELPLLGGGVWRNLVTPGKARVAETLDDLRGAHLYPRHSAQVRALSARVPLLSIWDDHEVRNDWFPGQIVERPGRAPLVIDSLAKHARRAMFEHTPTLITPDRPLYRSVRWGQRLELFLLDGRSYRTADYPAPKEEAFFGKAQVAWLEEAMRRSTATWKVVVCDMAIGLVLSSPAPVPCPADNPKCVALDGIGNANGPPSGRELELARLFASLRRNRVRNVVWLTADVHYAAAHHYDPSRAAFKDMDPFWEFVAGPMHALVFPRKPFDDTFGPEVAFTTAGDERYETPATDATSFGLVRIDGPTGRMRVTLVDGRGRDLHEVVLDPT